MAKFKQDDKALLEVTIMCAADPKGRVIVAVGNARYWLAEDDLMRLPSPVTVRCDKCGTERPLTDIKTLRERCKTLGIGEWGSASPHDFMEICAQLAEKGVTAEQFVEGAIGWT